MLENTSCCLELMCNGVICWWPRLATYSKNKQRKDNKRNNTKERTKTTTHNRPEQQTTTSERKKENNIPESLWDYLQLCSPGVFFHQCWRTLLVVRNWCVMVSFVGGLVWRHILNAERNQWVFVKVLKSGAWVPHFSVGRVFRNMFQIICSGVLQECSITSAGEHFLLSGMDV